MSKPWLAARAAHVLRGNASGSITRASPRLYPHQWSWDAAFNAIGLATVDLPRARGELDSLFRAQWHNGMVPHIVFDPRAEGYEPGPHRWACAEVSDQAPRGVATSGICQPPVHAIAVTRILQVAADDSRGDAWAALDWAGGVYPRLLAWHRYLHRCRRDPRSGLLTLFHGWESGMDNSPRWDEPYANVRPGADLPAYSRRDTGHVASAAERPTNAEYDRYLWLIEEAKQTGYDPARMRRTGSFAVGDVLFTAIFAAASDLLADLAERLGEPDGDELRQYAAAARSAVLGRVGGAEPWLVADTGLAADAGLAADLDLGTGRSLRTETIAGFAPLIAGGIPDDLRDRLTTMLLGPRWAGHPGLRWALPPSTSPCSAAFRRQGYWRGPVWPVMTWLIGWALRRDGQEDVAARLREASLAQLGDGTFAEYYDALDGNPLGSHHQSWTAAVALDWLLGPD